MGAAPASDAPVAAGLWRRRAAAIFEVVAVLLAGNILMQLTQRALGLASWKALRAEMVAAGEADFLLLSRVAAVELALKYGFLLGLAYGIGRWHRRRPWRAYGLHLGGRRVPRLLAVGVVLFAAGGLIPLGLRLAGRFADLGPGPEHWALHPDRPTPEFLLYMAVGSYLLVPVLEELLARGYMVTRLAEDYGAGGAIIIAGVVFSLSHGQYLKPSVMALGNLAGLLLASLFFGYVFWRTGSLAPGILAHALSNFPTPRGGPTDAVVVAALLAILAVARRPLAAWGCDLGRALARTDSWPATAAGALFFTGLIALIAPARHLLLPAAPVLLAIAVLLETADRGEAAPPPGHR